MVILVIVHCGRERQPKLLFDLGVKRGGTLPNQYILKSGEVLVHRRVTPRQRSPPRAGVRKGRLRGYLKEKDEATESPEGQKKKGRTAPASPSLHQWSQRRRRVGRPQQLRNVDEQKQHPGNGSDLARAHYCHRRPVTSPSVCDGRRGGKGYGPPCARSNRSALGGAPPLTRSGPPRLCAPLGRPPDRRGRTLPVLAPPATGPRPATNCPRQRESPRSTVAAAAAAAAVAAVVKRRAGDTAVCRRTRL